MLNSGTTDSLILLDKYAEFNNRTERKRFSFCHIFGYQIQKNLVQHSWCVEWNDGNVSRINSIYVTASNNKLTCELSIKIPIETFIHTHQFYNTSLYTILEYPSTSNHNPDLIFCSRGTSGIDIDLRRVDIDQCPLPKGGTQLNIFAASDKCKRTTQVSIFVQICSFCSFVDIYWKSDIAYTENVPCEIRRRSL